MFGWFDRMTVAKKLIVGVGALIVLLVAASTVSSLDSYQAQISIDDLARRGNQKALVNWIEADTFEGRMLVWRALATGDAQFWDAIDGKFEAAVNDLRQLISITRAADRRAKAAEIIDLYGDYRKIVAETRRVHTFAEAANDPSAKQILDAGGKLGSRIVESLSDLAKLNSHIADDTQLQAKAAANTALVVTQALTVASTLIAFALAILIVRSIRRPILAMTAVTGALARGDLSAAVPHADERNEIGDLARSIEVLKAGAIEKLRVEAEAGRERAAAEAERERQTAERNRLAEERAKAMDTLGAGLQRLADGDLTTRLADVFPPQFVKVRDDFNHAAERLMLTVRTVVASADAIQSGTREISTASNDLSARTEQQAASLEQTAAALDEITATLKKSAEGARHASEVVANADLDAKNGAVVVRQAVSAMDAIAKSSHQIGQIIGVIDEIAFQTNLLALNAGVEAARAGDAGKGFAVVASEVRGLAQRSADAAKEIKGLISTSAGQVDSGVKLVAETGKALERIIAQVSEINQVVADIAAGAREQANGLQEVNSAINQMDQVTQQNATMVEESTAASRSLSQETTQLSSLVDQFQLGRARGGADLRRELQKAAPHAFAAPVAPPRRATGGARGSKGGDWADF